MSSLVTFKNVPILDEHDLTDDEGEVVVKVDEKKLYQIARNNNDRVRATGDETPITIGHTQDDVPEASQPEIVGYASNFRVQPLFKTGKKCITATFRFFKDKIGKVRQFPRRSVELWLKQWMIDPIALLGASTPDRDLGLLRFSKNRLSYRRVFSKGQKPLDSTQNLVAQVVAALKETKEWKMLEQLSQSGEAPVGGEGEPEPDMDLLSGPGQEEGLGEEPPVEDLPVGGPGDEEPLEEEEEVPAKRYSASYGSGTNTFIPPNTNKKMSKTRFDQLAYRSARTEQALARQSAINKHLKIRLRRVEREKDLMQLETLGYEFDREEELNDVEEMTDKQYQRHLEKMKKRYSRAPISPDEMEAVKYSRSSSSGRSKEDVTAVAKYAIDNGISYEKALRDLHGSNKVS